MATRDTFELVELAGGGTSIRSLDNRQTFHPVVGPAVEAQAVHVAGTRLIERANENARAAAEASADAAVGGTVIWDVGLGAAANALAAIEALQAGYQGRADITLLSFDCTDAALDFALANATALGYAEQRLGWLEALRADGQTSIPLPWQSAPNPNEVNSPNVVHEANAAQGTNAPNAAQIHWRFCQGDFPALLRSADILSAPHAIFFDPYSPAVNPEMWTLDLFTALRARLQPGAPCLLTTYTRSTAVRATLLLAGFFVGIGPATGEKDQTTIAANDFHLLQHPLDRRWLERAHVSTNAAPLRVPIYTRGPISEEDFEQLRGHAQFRAG